jgi:hypothetical protein
MIWFFYYLLLLLLFFDLARMMMVSCDCDIVENNIVCMVAVIKASMSPFPNGVHRRAAGSFSRKSN